MCLGNNSTPESVLGDVSQNTEMSQKCHNIGQLGVASKQSIIELPGKGHTAVQKRTQGQGLEQVQKTAGAGAESRPLEHASTPKLNLQTGRGIDLPSAASHCCLPYNVLTTVYNSGRANFKYPGLYGWEGSTCATSRLSDRRVGTVQLGR